MRLASCPAAAGGGAGGRRRPSPEGAALSQHGASPRADSHPAARPPERWRPQGPPLRTAPPRPSYPSVAIWEVGIRPVAPAPKGRRHPSTGHRPGRNPTGARRPTGRPQGPPPTDRASRPSYPSVSICEICGSVRPSPRPSPEGAALCQHGASPRAEDPQAGGRHIGRPLRASYLRFRPPSPPGTNFPQGPELAGRDRRPFSRFRVVGVFRGSPRPFVLSVCSVVRPPYALRITHHASRITRPRPLQQLLDPLRQGPRHPRHLHQLLHRGRPHPRHRAEALEQPGLARADRCPSPRPAGECRPASLRSRWW